MSIINGNVCIVNGTPVDKVFSNGKQVYGRNYALNTANTITVTGNNTVGQMLGNYPVSNKISVISIGTKLTISCDIDVTNADGGKSYFGWKGTHAWQPFISAKTFVEGKNHVSLTFDLNTALPVGTILNMTIDNSTATYSLSNLMLEVSSLESCHSLAPEDVLK